MSFYRYVSINGSKQGQIKFVRKKGGHKDKWIPIFAFDYGTESPHDSNSGQETGRRTHSPVTVTKESSSAAPQIFQAHLANEVLSEVVIQTLLRPSSGAGETTPEPVYQRITLTNATISKIERYTAIPPHESGRIPKDGYQKVEFNFQKIKFENMGG